MLKWAKLGGLGGFGARDRELGLYPPILLHLSTSVVMGTYFCDVGQWTYGGYLNRRVSTFLLLKKKLLVSSASAFVSCAA